MSEQMIDAVTFPDGARVLELGGGENRHQQATCMVDVRPGPLVDFPVDLNSVPLPIAPDDFDVVYASFVLEHLPYVNVAPLLKDCFRIVRPGGAVVFIVPNTEEQLRWIQKHPDGWDGKDFYTSASELLFGSQTYAANFHVAYFSADVATRLFSDAGFEQIQTMRFGSAGTDLLIKARKASVAAGQSAVVQPPVPSVVETVPAEELYDRHYWHGGSKYGGYAGSGYADFPVHEVTFRHVMARKPESVLELGAARGYIGKRLEDAGVRYWGLEVSKHCYMTRVVDSISRYDICKVDANNCWPIFNHNGGGLDTRFDLAFSIAVFEHIPEDKLPGIFAELKRTTKRGLHGIDFGGHDDGFDKTHCTLKSKEWWRSRFDAAGLQSHEIVDKESLEQGDYRNGLPEDYLRGDGKVKVNAGSFTTMFHHGWINLDQHNLNDHAQRNGYGFVQHDVLKGGLPFQTGKVDLVMMHHVLEHFTYGEGLSLLRELRRCIKRTGAMRIVVPNLAELAFCYTDEVDHDRLRAFSEINDDCDKALTDAMRLHALLQGGDHKAFYDWDTLNHQLKEAGWTAYPASFRKTEVEGVRQILRETTEMDFGGLSLFVDAVPKLG